MDAKVSMFDWPSLIDEKEKWDLLIAWIALSIAFGLSFARNSGLLFSFATSFLGVGTGFIFHELGHKFAGIHYGASAGFRKWDLGLGLALLLGAMSFFNVFGFIFAAPGATYIYSEHISRKQNGIISLVGPAINIALAIALFLLSIFSAIFFPSGLIAGVLLFAAIINLYLAFFNMLPIPPLDGSKVIVWNPIIWGAVFVPLLYLFYFSGIL